MSRISAADDPATYAIAQGEPRVFRGGALIAVIPIDAAFVARAATAHSEAVAERERKGNKR